MRDLSGLETQNLNGRIPGSSGSRFHVLVDEGENQNMPNLDTTSGHQSASDHATHIQVGQGMPRQCHLVHGDKEGSAGTGGD
ncbi:Glycoside hydrolase [Sesbania bispinosa]|nr:Glycoside hydrolase [Sesbania bispinosa]